MLFRLPEINFIDDKAGKPVGINEHIGRRPIAAFGNSDGDLEMLQWTTMSGSGARLGLIVHHTDAEREYAYDRQSHFGKLDKALDAAAVNKWTVVNMKKDWKHVFRVRELAQRGDIMKATAVLLPLVAALCLGVASAQAGPCSNEIAQFEQAVRQSAGNPNAGRSRRNRSAPNSIANRRPPRSNGPSARAQATFDAALARAKRLDARGNRAGCTRALAAAKRMYNLQ